MEIRPIPTHSTYGASTDGHIYCLRTETQLKEQNSANGYKRVYLQNKDGIKLYSVHRLVALTFIPKIEGKDEIDHIDRNPANNIVSNLRWVNDCEQAVNKKGWGKYPKYIHLEHPNHQHRMYESWVLTIQNHKLKFKKRFKTTDYTLEQVVEFRNNLLTENGIEVID